MFRSILQTGVLTGCLFYFSVVWSFAQTDSLALSDIEEHRKTQMAEIHDSEKSPFTSEERKKMEVLNYFPIDLKYRVNAKFIQTDSPVLFKMKTTTSRLPEYRKYGELHFTLDGKQLKLEVYQNPDLSKKEGYEDYLFVPFTDLTNGEETYDIGRYINFRIPSTGDVVLDFNKSYNPYCSYSSRFSCPIPPSANDLPIAIRAGEMKFKDH